MNRRELIFCVPALTAGCVAVPRADQPHDVVDNTPLDLRIGTMSSAQAVSLARFRNNPYDAGWSVSLPIQTVDRRRSGDREMYALEVIATVIKHDQSEHLIIVLSSTLWGFAWRHYHSASLLGGQTLPALNRSADVSLCGSLGCTYRESASFRLPIGQVAAGARLQLRINPRAGPEIFLDGSPGAIDGLRQALKAWKMRPETQNSQNN